MTLFSLLMAGLTSWATPCEIGLLKRRDTGARFLYTQARYFTCTPDGLVGKRVPESSEPQPGRFTAGSGARVTFDGRVIASLVAMTDFSTVATDSMPGEIDRKFAWLRERQRPAILITTNNLRFKDPRGWKRIEPVLALRRQVIDQLRDLAQTCRPKPVSVDRFKIETVYASQDEKTHLLRVRTDSCVNWASLRETTLFEEPHDLWLHRAADGTWTRKFGSRLIDIGDFDASDRALGVFYAADESTTPDGVAEIYEMNTFKRLAEAQDGGYLSFK